MVLNQVRWALERRWGFAAKPLDAAVKEIVSRGVAYRSPSGVYVVAPRGARAVIRYKVWMVTWRGRVIAHDDTLVNAAPRELADAYKGLVGYAPSLVTEKTHIIVVPLTPREAFIVTRAGRLRTPLPVIAEADWLTHRGLL